MIRATLPAYDRHRRQRVRLEDVAREGGVHVSTASRALAPDGEERLSRETVARVREVARRLGYQRDAIATGLRRGATMSMGVVVPDLENPFQGPFLRGVAATLEEREFVPLVTETLEDRERFIRVLDHLLSRRVSAIIASTARFRDRDVLEQVAASEIPFVLAVRKLDDVALPSVTTDERLGAGLAARHLLELGHRRVAQLRGPADMSTFVERSDTFRSVVSSSGAEDLTLDETPTMPPTIDAGYALMLQTLDETGGNAPTAVFAHTDVMAIGAIRALRERGFSCPGDVSVVGYNNAPLTDAVEPPLSTVHVAGEAIGREAARLALAWVNDQGAPPKSVVLPATLIVRSSTAPPRRASATKRSRARR
jgi:LacI family transcriptional regulator